MHAKRNCKDFEINKSGKYNDLYVQSNKLLFKAINYCYLMCLTNLEMCLEIYELDWWNFLSAPGLAWQEALKKTKIELDLLTDIDVINGWKGIRGGICHSIYWHAKANNKYIKDYDKK